MEVCADAGGITPFRGVRLQTKDCEDHQLPDPGVQDHYYVRPPRRAGQEQQSGGRRGIPQQEGQPGSPRLPDLH